jgi:hypothetical protein
VRSENKEKDYLQNGRVFVSKYFKYSGEEALKPFAGF